MNQQPPARTYGDALFERLEAQVRDISSRLSRLSSGLDPSSVPVEDSAQPAESADQESAPMVPKPEPASQHSEPATHKPAASIPDSELRTALLEPAERRLPTEERQATDERQLKPRSILTETVETSSAVEGYFVTDSDLRVAGVITGNLICHGILYVTEHGVVRASVSASQIVVAGRLEGDIQCHGRFVVLPTGSVDAKVSAAVAVLEPGARFAGELNLYESSSRGTPVSDQDPTPPRVPDQSPNRNGVGSRSMRSGSFAFTDTEGPKAQDRRPSLVRAVQAYRQVTRPGRAQSDIVRAASGVRVAPPKQQEQKLTRNGKRTGRPRVIDREGFEDRFTTVLERLKRGELSHRGAARELSIGHATLLRLLRQKNLGGHS